MFWLATILLVVAVVGGRWLLRNDPKTPGLRGISPSSWKQWRKVIREFHDSDPPPPKDPGERPRG